jgi:hypothetical protein
VVGSCEHGNTRSASVKSEEFLDRLSNLAVFMMGCAPWSFYGVITHNIPLNLSFKTVDYSLIF